MANKITYPTKEKGNPDVTIGKFRDADANEIKEKFNGVVDEVNGFKNYVDNSTGVSEALKVFQKDIDVKNYPEWSETYFAASKITRIEKTTTISTVQYKIGNGAFITPPLAQTIDINIPAGTVTWRITYAANQSEGAISIQGRKV